MLNTFHFVTDFITMPKTSKKSVVSDADPQRRASYLTAEKERRTKKAEKKWKPVAELTDREKRKRQKYNRQGQTKHREKLKVLQTVPTPPSTPETATSISR